MILNFTYDTSVNSAPTGFTAALSQLANFFDNTFTDPVTVTIAVGYGEVHGQTIAGSLGESFTSFRGYSYGQIRTALLADAKSTDDTSAVASLPASDPTGGHYWVSTAESKALGLSASNNLIDGYIGFGNQYGFDYDNSNGVTAGQYDFFGVAAHEVSEVLGRQLLVGGSMGNTTNSYMPLDLFHFASPGVHIFSGNQAGYFSPDNGVDNLDNFNTNPGGDAGDWAASAGNDAALAFSPSGTVNAFSQNDIRLMDTIGWDVASPNASPSPPVVTASLHVSSDFNGDGYGDLLFQLSNGSAAIWEMNGLTPINGAVVPLTPDPSWHMKATADFNGDGEADILWQSDSGRPGIWLMNGMTPVASALVGPTPPSGWKVVGGGDFNGDGKSDILWQTDTGRAAIWLMDGLTAIGGDIVGPSVPAGWKVIGSGDFNGDGKSDILWQTPTGQPAIWLMNGLSVLNGDESGPNPGTSWHIKAIGDFNGDGNDDILWQLDDGRVAVWLMSGTAPVGGDVVGPNPGPSWHAREAVDINGDGKADIVWQTDSGALAAWTMDGTHVLSGDTFGPNPGTSWHLMDGLAV